MDLEQEVDDRGGLIGIPDLSDLTGLDPRPLRDYAEENGIAVVGRAYVFTTEQALDAYEELCEEEPEDEDDGDESEDEEEHGCDASIDCYEE